MTNALLRERIIFNNSLASYESRAGYGYNLDQYYFDKSSDNEVLLEGLKQTHASILNGMVDMLNVHDSPQFCAQVI